MKFWQLVSICKQYDFSLENFLNIQKNNDLLSWVKCFDDLVVAQDRSKLDKKIEHSLCVAVFSSIDANMYIRAGYLRGTKFDDSDQPISILEAYEKYGGEKMEDAWEYGCVKIS